LFRPDECDGPGQRRPCEVSGGEAHEGVEFEERGESAGEDEDVDAGGGEGWVGGGGRGGGCGDGRGGGGGVEEIEVAGIAEPAAERQWRFSDVVQESHWALYHGDFPSLPVVRLRMEGLG
jgi:hypothetical protein